MLKNALFIIGCCLLWSVSSGQGPAPWAEPGRMYFKIPVAADGIYRVTFEQLTQAGFPAGTSDPAFIQLYHRGLEQAIYVEGEADNVFNAGDYIEFYGRRNDGRSDAPLFPEGVLPQPEYNLFSDTTAFFLTVGMNKGKRMPLLNGGDGAAMMPEPYHSGEKLHVLSEQFHGGENQNRQFYSSAFEKGEGWFSTLLAPAQQRDFTISGITSAFRSAPHLPQLEVQLVGQMQAAHTVEIYAGESARLAGTASFQGFDSFTFSSALLWEDITASGTLKVRVHVVSNGVPDLVGIAYFRVNYPAAFEGAGEEPRVFRLNQPPGEHALVSISDYKLSQQLYNVTDPASVSRIAVTGSSTIGSAVVPGSARRLLLNSAPLPVSSIRKVTFQSIASTSRRFVIITHPQLRKPSGVYSDPVQAYADYRASAAGGGYQPLVINIDELYDQFNFGEKSPLAVYRFIEYLRTQQTPHYLFIIGKGMEVWYNAGRRSQFAPMDLIPPGGYPASDLVFSSGRKVDKPVIPTGRLTALTSAEVAAYLEKVIENEASVAPELWRKNILHLSGGIEQYEPELFYNIMQQYQRIAEGPYLGASVTPIAKNSTSLKLINISEEVNRGVGMITFFGHSSPNTLDFDIGRVTDPVMGYNNRGKYPLLLMNGCEAGAFFLNYRLFGEDWMLAEKRGAIGFIAHNSFAIVPTLDAYTKLFYNVGFADSVFMKKGIGDIQAEVARRYMAQMTTSEVNLSQVQQMIFLGDPAVRLNRASKPDLEISSSQVTAEAFERQPISILADSFAIRVIVRNNGMATRDLFRMEVKRTMADYSVLYYDSLFKIPDYSDTLLFIIRRGTENAGGNNRFEIFLDADNVIAELNENNNTADYTLVVPSNGTRNLYPPPFSIVRKRRTELVFQSADLLAGPKSYLIELDTAGTFDSPYRRQWKVSGEVLLRQEADLLSRDSTAYYWRTKIENPRAGESTGWATGTFTYIENGTEGWAQVHFPQFMENGTNGITLVATARRIEFEKSVTPVSITVFGASSGKLASEVSVKIKGAEYNLYSMAGGGFGCRNNTFNLIAFNRSSTIPYPGVYLKWYELLWKYGRRLCGREPFVINSFTSDEVDRGGDADLLRYVDNVEEGDSVIMYTMGDAGVHLWPESARLKLAAFGVSIGQLSALVAGEPFVILGRKGAPAGSAKIFRTDADDPRSAMLYVNASVTGGFTSGTVSSPLIGPATSWHSLKWRAAEVFAQDRVSLDIRGVSLGGDETTIAEDVPFDRDLSFVDPALYPFIRMVFHASDKTLLSAAQLTKWLVTFDGVPEGIVLPSSESGPFKVREGEPWIRQYSFANISERAFSDSLSVNASLFNAEKSERRESRFKIKAPLPGQQTVFTVRHATAGFPGWNDAEVFVNPRIFAEQYYDNNLLQMRQYLQVERDRTSPVLDVTFDGRKLENDDFVSPNPLIRIAVRDENQFLLKQDTTGVRILITYPCTPPLCTEVPVSLRGSTVKWYKATATKDFYIEYTPRDLPPGAYRLRAEGADASGNKAAVPYEILFNVSDQSSIDFIPLYPNPADGYANYGFVLAGANLPESARMTIFNSLGRSVFEREILRESFFVGRNTFSWSAGDFLGNKVAAGVYFYTFVVQLDGATRKFSGKIVVK